MSGDVVVRLAAGETSTGTSSTGVRDIIKIAAGTVIENAVTGDGNDKHHRQRCWQTRSTACAATTRSRAAAGGDTLSGGAGNDTLTGGTGLDFFLFDRALNSADQRRHHHRLLAPRRRHLARCDDLRRSFARNTERGRVLCRVERAGRARPHHLRLADGRPLLRRRRQQRRLLRSSSRRCRTPRRPVLGRLRGRRRSSPRHRRRRRTARRTRLRRGGLPESRRCGGDGTHSSAPKATTSCAAISPTTRFFGFGGEDIIITGDGDDFVDAGRGWIPSWQAAATTSLSAAARPTTIGDIIYGGAGDDVIIGSDNQITT